MGEVAVELGGTSFVPTSVVATFEVFKLDAFRRAGLGLDFFFPISTGVTTLAAFEDMIAVCTLHHHSINISEMQFDGDGAESLRL